METPSVGLDTFGLNESDEASVASGYELVDVCESNGNLAVVGTGLKKCSQKPYVIVKLSGMPSGDYQDVEERLQNILDQLDIKRADLCLMQWPGLCNWDVTDMKPLASPEAFKGKASKFTVFCDHVGPAWSNMVKLREAGLCTEIGTSNFYSEHLEMLKKKCEGAKPFANEIFVNVTNHEMEFVHEMQTQGIKVLGYHAVDSQPFPEPVQELAKRFGEDMLPQSIILTWLMKRGIWPLVSCNGDHTDQDLHKPAKITRIKEMLTLEDLALFVKNEVGLEFSREWFAKIWKNHNKTTKYTEEDLQKLIKKGVDEEKAKAVLEKTGGDIKMAAFYCGV